MVLNTKATKVTPRPQRFLLGRYRAFINVSHGWFEEQGVHTSFKPSSVGLSCPAAGGFSCPAGRETRRVGAGVLSVRELARKDGKGLRANRRKAIPGPAGFRGRRGSAQPRAGEDR